MRLIHNAASIASFPGSGFAGPRTGYTAGDHQHAEADHVGQAMADPAGLPVIGNAGCQPPPDIQPPLDLAQHRTPASEVRLPPSKAASTVLPETGDRPGSRGVVLHMTGECSADWAGLGFSKLILNQISSLRYTRGPSGRCPCIIRARSAALRNHLTASTRLDY